MGVDYPGSTPPCRPDSLHGGPGVAPEGTSVRPTPRSCSDRGGDRRQMSTLKKGRERHPPPTCARPVGVRGSPGVGSGRDPPHPYPDPGVERVLGWDHVEVRTEKRTSCLPGPHRTGTAPVVPHPYVHSGRTPRVGGKTVDPEGPSHHTEGQTVKSLPETSTPPTDTPVSLGPFSHPLPRDTGVRWAPPRPGPRTPSTTPGSPEKQVRPFRTSCSVSGKWGVGRFRNSRPVGGCSSQGRLPRRVMTRRVWRREG